MDITQEWRWERWRREIWAKEAVEGKTHGKTSWYRKGKTEMYDSACPAAWAYTGK